MRRDLICHRAEQEGLGTGNIAEKSERLPEYALIRENTMWVSSWRDKRLAIYRGSGRLSIATDSHRQFYEVFDHLEPDYASRNGADLGGSNQKIHSTLESLPRMSPTPDQVRE